MVSKTDKTSHSVPHGFDFEYYWCSTYTPFLGGEMPSRLSWVERVVVLRTYDYIGALNHQKTKVKYLNQLAEIK